MKILVAGYYGFGNVGDELILQVLRSQLMSRYPQSEICVLSADPEWTNRMHGVRSRSRWNIVAVLTEMWKADLFVLGGGGLLQDQTSSRSLQYYLALLMAARWLGNRTVVYAVGVEHLTGRFNRALVRRALNHRSVVTTVRDLESKALLAECGVDLGRVHLTGDPVFLTPGVTIAPPPRASERLRALFVPRFPCPTAGQNLYSHIVWFLKDHLEMDVMGALFSPRLEEPHLTRSQLIQRLSADHFLMSEIPSAILSEMSQVDVVVSARFHGLVMAALTGRPFLGIGDEEKVGRFCRAWGAPFIPWNAGYDGVEEILMSWLEGTPKVPAEQVNASKAQAKITIDYLESSLGLQS